MVEEENQQKKINNIKNRLEKELQELKKLKDMRKIF